MEVLITGVSGLIGSRITQYLCKNNIKVVGCGRAKKSPFKIKNFEYFSFDWNNFYLIEKYLSTGKVSSIIHLAAMQSPISETNVLECLELNTISTYRLAEIALKNKVKQFIFFSTMHVYQQLEDKTKLISPQTKNRIYPVSKLMGEYLLNTINFDDSETKNIIIRLSNAVGGGYPISNNKTQLLVNSLCTQAVEKKYIALKSDPLTIRDFIPIESLCRILADKILFNENKEGIIDISSGENLTILHIAKLIKKQYISIFNREIEIHIEDRYKGKNLYYANPSTKLEKDLKKEINRLLIGIS